MILRYIYFKGVAYLIPKILHKGNKAENEALKTANSSGQFFDGTMHHVEDVQSYERGRKRTQTAKHAVCDPRQLLDHNSPNTKHGLFPAMSLCHLLS